MHRVMYIPSPSMIVANTDSGIKMRILAILPMGSVAGSTLIKSVTVSQRRW